MTQIWRFLGWPGALLILLNLVTAGYMLHRGVIINPLLAVAALGLDATWLVARYRGD